MNYTGVSVLAALCIAAIGWARWRTGEYCSPFSIIVAAWGSTFALFLLRFLPYAPLSTRAAFIMTLGVGGLLCGSLVGERVGRRSSPLWTSSTGASAWILPYALLGIAGTAWYLWLVRRHVGWHALTENARLIRIALVTYQIPSRYLFLQFFCIATSLLVGALVLTGSRLRWWQWLLAGGCLTGTLVTTDRTQFFTVFLTCGFMYLYRRGPELRLSRVAVSLAIVLVLLTAHFLLVGAWVGKSAELLGTSAWFPGRVEGAERTAPGRNPAVAAAAARASTLYLYATGSYPAFSVWSERDRPWTWGLEAVYPVARALDRLRLLRVPLPPALPEETVILQKGSTAVPFNAYTFLYYPMRDLGVAGVAVYSVAIGVLAGSAYRRTCRARCSPLHLLVLGQISTALALTVFVNKFNNTASWYIFVLTTLPFLVPPALARLRERFQRA